MKKELDDISDPYEDLPPPSIHINIEDFPEFVVAACVMSAHSRQNSIEEFSFFSNGQEHQESQYSHLPVFGEQRDDGIENNADGFFN